MIAPICFRAFRRLPLVIALAAAVAAPVIAQTVTTNSLVINGRLAYQYSGASVSSAGDVNGDGLDDLTIGAPSRGGLANSVSSQAYVVFGTKSRTPINLRDIATGKGGFAINPQSATDRVGFSLSSAGDVNGDGFDDLLVGAPGPVAGTARNAGRAYVVLGKSSTSAVSLSDVAANRGGFAINGEAVNDQSGISVSSAGDVNGDGLMDIIVGAPSHASSRGRSYVVFGRAATGAVNLSNVAAGNGGFAINGELNGNLSGSSVAGAGDVNGDGFDDVVISAPNSSRSGPQAGRSYVVLGKASTSAVNLLNVAGGAGGFAINGPQLFAGGGTVVAGAGDVNGDGFDDVVIGLPLGSVDQRNRYQSGRSYVVYGKKNTSQVSLAALNTGTGGGFVINGELRADFSGTSVAALGDINGDGLADIIIGAPKANTRRMDAGKTYVVFGKKNQTPVELPTLNATKSGFTIIGDQSFDYSGGSVSSAGDFDGDGLPDFAIGAFGGNPEARWVNRRNPATGFRAGKTFVIFGGQR